MKNLFKNIGPGPLVAAAFIGPGTVTLCTLAGINFGFGLLWALLLSIFATVILQEMAARLGIVTQKGLSETLREEVQHPILKTLIVTLILSAIVIGNAAYEAGNISGGALGIETLFGKFKFAGLDVWPILIGISAFVMLWIGNYKVIERSLIALVVLMSLAFIVTAILTKPDITAVFKGLFTPRISNQNILTVIGLIGTTVVPYNIFLHASLAKTKWDSKSDLKYARKDTIIAVVLGGVVSMCIVICAAAVNQKNIANAADLALGLQPLFGEFAGFFLSIGLFAAGITSAIAAPLAAAFVTSGCLGWKSNLKSKKFRMVWAFILLLGVVFSSVGFKSIEIIKFAQVANGLLLPIIAGVLLWIMNKSNILGPHKNALIQNILGIVIFAVTIFLGGKTILSVFNVI
ncbi:Nramp family divalent metal transporter [Winogradskyella litorisediminis]|uniref:Nramp family divalent metal transporter n=1 Tax=Winogradskyella litorisediminis TaxID=1156618 RepID=A0ABW3N7T9_9FLAO